MRKGELLLILLGRLHPLLIPDTCASSSLHFALSVRKKFDMPCRETDSIVEGNVYLIWMCTRITEKVKPRKQFFPFSRKSFIHPPPPRFSKMLLQRESPFEQYLYTTHMCMNKRASRGGEKATYSKKVWGFSLLGTGDEFEWLIARDGKKSLWRLSQSFIGFLAPKEAKSVTDKCCLLASFPCKSSFF